MSPRAFSHRCSNESEPSPATAHLSQLLNRVALGDERAFLRFYELTSARVHGVVLRVLRNQIEATEVTKDTYLQAWLLSARFDASIGTALPWLLMIAHRRAVDRARARADVPAEDGGSAQTAGDSERLDDPTRKNWLSGAQAGPVRDALLQLSDLHRDVLVLSYLDGHTHNDVAKLLNVPLGSAKVHLRDALLRLSDLIPAAALV